MKTGVYKIENIANDKFYIGQAVDLGIRKKSHWAALRTNRHTNGHLQRAWNKYGKDNFIFSVVLFCEKNALTYYEQMLVDLWKPEYNICRECVNSTAGTKRSDEQRKRMSGRIFSEGTKQKISKANKGRKPWIFGKHLSEETKKKLSDKNKGKTPSRETINKALERTRGKHLSEEHKKKISDGNKGKHLSEECKRKLSAAHKGKMPWTFGKHHSEETINKLREINKGRKPWGGNPPSEETRRKLSEAGKRPCSEETKRKIAKSNKGHKNCLGRHLSDETKRKIANSLMGHSYSEETRLKMSISQKARFNKQNMNKADAQI